MLIDPPGQPCRSRRSGGLATRPVYDVLRRPVRSYDKVGEKRLA